MSRRIFYALTAFFLALTFCEAARWRLLENCTLVDNPSNDADSFHVRHKRSRYLFRLYFVDAPETDNSFPERVQTQAEYFGLDESKAIQLGKEAARFTEKMLADGFSVWTRRHDARGRSEKNRYYAIVEAGGKDLAEELVRAGYARVFGQEVELPDGTRSATMWRRLRQAELEAKRNKAGAWSPKYSPASGGPITGDLTPQDWVLPQSIAVFSTDGQNRQLGILPKGAPVRVIGSENPAIARISFRSSSGVQEVLCRRADLGL